MDTKSTVDGRQGVLSRAYLLSADRSPRTPVTARRELEPTARLTSEDPHWPVLRYAQLRTRESGIFVIPHD